MVNSPGIFVLPFSFSITESFAALIESAIGVRGFGLGAFFTCAEAATEKSETIKTRMIDLLMKKVLVKKQAV